MRNLKHAAAFLEQGQNKVFPDCLIYHWSSYSIKDESIWKKYMSAGLDSLWIDGICIREIRSSLGRRSGNSGTKNKKPNKPFSLSWMLSSWEPPSVSSFLDKSYISSLVAEPTQSIVAWLSVQSSAWANLPSSGSPWPQEWVHILNLTHNRLRKEHTTSSLSYLLVWHCFKYLVQGFCWDRSSLQTSSDVNHELGHFSALPISHQPLVHVEKIRLNIMLWVTSALWFTQMWRNSQLIDTLTVAPIFQNIYMKD